MPDVSIEVSDPRPRTGLLRVVSYADNDVTETSYYKERALEILQESLVKSLYAAISDGRRYGVQYRGVQAFPDLVQGREERSLSVYVALLDPSDAKVGEHVWEQSLSESVGSLKDRLAASYKGMRFRYAATLWERVS